MTLRLIAMGVAVAVAAVGAQASAHARLIAADPAPNARVAAPKQLTLHFSEKLNPQFSSLTLTRPKMDNRAAPLKVAVSADRRSLIATPIQPLSAGVYKVNWRAVATDTHRVLGAYSFTVR